MILRSLIFQLFHSVQSIHMLILMLLEHISQGDFTTYRLHVGLNMALLCSVSLCYQMFISLRHSLGLWDVTCQLSIMMHVLLLGDSSLKDMKHILREVPQKFMKQLYDSFDTLERWQFSATQSAVWMQTATPPKFPTPKSNTQQLVFIPIYIKLCSHGRCLFLITAYWKPN